MSRLDKSKVLMLQGPVGPFFKHLQNVLIANGFNVSRVCFNYSDHFFSAKKDNVHFSGDEAEWREWLFDFVKNNKINYIIYFGSDRVIHKIAFEVAQLEKIETISLEEGYLRNGFITVEKNGNNSRSPIAGKMMPSDFQPTDDMEVEHLNGNLYMGLYGAIYYTLRNLFSYGKKRKLFHRDISLVTESFYWLRNAYARLVNTSKDRDTIKDLIENSNKNFYLVPLQVGADSQLKSPALNWNSERLIKETLKSFALQDFEKKLVFKIHPLDIGHYNYKQFIHAQAEKLGIMNKVEVICVGNLGSLVKHALGMITINSTSGLSAIYHGVSLLVIGRSVYANSELAVCADGNPNFDKFWHNQKVADYVTRINYLNWLKNMALVPGDFYHSCGIKKSCAHIVAKIGKGL